MNYGQPRQSGNYDRNSRPPAPTIDVSDIRFGEAMPELLFADIAQDKAQIVAEAGRLARGKNKYTQLRKFYDELVMWHEKVAFEQSAEAKSGKYKELAPYIKMMKAKVAYAKGREHVDECYEKLFSHVISQIGSPETLKHAKLFMEAFMGFYKAKEK
ncbi:MAG: type III-A CRISPR-associated protein Csm2 [Dechloromonas sp.]|nr:MAG: type III-A CRISPR-associated protein Csm2 [Dechloromonas sp.]